MREINKVEVYTDGSYNKNYPDITRGGVVILIDGRPYAFVKVSTKREVYVQQWNIGGELIAAQFGLNMTLSLLERFRDNGAKVPDYIDLYHDWVGVNDLVRMNPQTGKMFKSNKPGCLFYKDFYKELVKMYPTVINFHWVKSHSGNRWNEIVDTLAKGYWPVGEYGDVIRKEIEF